MKSPEVPPPHGAWPVVLLAPIVVPWITNIPTGSGTAAPGQSSRFSVAHMAEQPSAGVVLPSSHCSPASTIPLPHTCPPELELTELLLLAALLLLLAALLLLLAALLLLLAALLLLLAALLLLLAALLLLLAALLLLLLAALLLLLLAA